jgi:hypothetical protein
MLSAGKYPAQLGDVMVLEASTLALLVKNQTAAVRHISFQGRESTSDR